VPPLPARLTPTVRRAEGQAVGHHDRVTHADGLDALADLVADGDVVVLSGAGLSTESGIPDYRGPNGSLQRHTPMTYQAFTRSAWDRRRYWARSHVGWRHVARAAPNDGHRAVAALQRRGLLSRVVTQNVDGLHQAGGARDVIELHGSLDRVVCLDCGETSARERLDQRLRAANPDFEAAVREVNPDGDVDLPDSDVQRFQPADCATCGGTLKPDVVFFGETVPPGRVAECYCLVERAGTLLVLGSSLTVMSGHRFVLRAAKLGVPVALVNQGASRGDVHATVKVEAPLGWVLPELARRLGADDPGATAGSGRPAPSAAGLLLPA
jgi:NAD-dependent SIR2 family protein deacetylase